MMRVLTVRAPWSWLLVEGGKDVENRPRNVAGDHRGAVAIQTAVQTDALAHRRESWHAAVLSMEAWIADGSSGALVPWWENRGHIIGVADLVDVHAGPHHWKSRRRNPVACDGHDGLCSPWGEEDALHLVLRNPRPLSEPMPYRGALHLQTMTPADEAELLRRVA